MKKIKMIILALTTALLIIGCALPGKGKGQKKDEAGNGNAVPSAEAVVISVQETENPVEIQTCQSKENAHEIYEGFLNGKAGMKLHSANEFFTSLDLSAFFQNGQEVRLKEYAERIAAQIKEEWYLEDEIKPSCEAAYLDCGEDGSEELAIRLIFPTQIEEWVIYLVLHAENGMLQESFSADAYARKGIDLNRNGYIVSGGSNGASSHTSEWFLIDADGNPHFLYGINTEYDPMSFYYDGESVFLPETLYSEADAEIQEYYFDWDYTSRTGYLVLSLPGKETSEKSIPEHPLRTELEKLKVNWIPASDASQMVESRRSDAGYQEKLAEAPEPDWIPVTIS